MPVNRAAAILAACAACGASSKPTVENVAAGSSATGLADRCAMIEAAFRLEEFRKFACGQAATRDHRILVEVDMKPPFRPGETCASDVFAIYRRGEPTNTDAVLRISIGPHGKGTWGFGAEYFDPPNSPDDHPVGGGYDDANYYCGFVDGRLARSANGWRAWVDHGDDTRSSTAR